MFDNFIDMRNLIVQKIEQQIKECNFLLPSKEIYTDMESFFYNNFKSELPTDVSRSKDGPLFPKVEQETKDFYRRTNYKESGFHSLQLPSSTARVISLQKYATNTLTVGLNRVKKIGSLERNLVENK